MQNRDPYIRDIGSRIILFSSSWVSIMVLLAALKSCGNHPVRGTLVTCWAPLSEVVLPSGRVCPMLRPDQVLAPSWVLERGWSWLEPSCWPAFLRSRRCPLPRSEHDRSKLKFKLSATKCWLPSMLNSKKVHTLTSKKCWCYTNVRNHVCWALACWRTMWWGVMIQRVFCWPLSAPWLEKCMSVCVRHAPCSHVYTRAHACAHAAVKPLLMLVFASSAGLWAQHRWDASRASVATCLVKMSAVLCCCWPHWSWWSSRGHVAQVVVRKGVWARCALLSLRIQSLLPCSSSSERLCGSWCWPSWYWALPVGSSWCGWFGCSCVDSMQFRLRTALLCAIFACARLQKWIVDPMNLRTNPDVDFLAVAHPA